jgi:hypothetical protein
MEKLSRGVAHNTFLFPVRSIETQLNTGHPFRLVQGISDRLCLVLYFCGAFIFWGLPG